MTSIGIPIDERLLLDTANTAIEWSCRDFWAQIDRFPSYLLFEDYENRIKAGTLPKDEVLFRIRDDEDGEADEEDRPWVDVTLATLEVAMQQALVEYNHLYTFSVEGGRIVDCDTDGPSADIVLQLAVLRDKEGNPEVVYG